MISRDGPGASISAFRQAGSVAAPLCTGTMIDSLGGAIVGVTAPSPGTVPGAWSPPPNPPIPSQTWSSNFTSSESMALASRASGNCGRLWPAGNMRDAIHSRSRSPGRGKFAQFGGERSGSGPAWRPEIWPRKWPMSPVPVRTTSAPESCRQKRIAASCRLPTPCALSSDVKFRQAYAGPLQQRLGFCFTAKRPKGVHRDDAGAMLPRLGGDWAAGPVDEIEPDHDRVEGAACRRAGQHRVPGVAPEGLGNPDDADLALFLQPRGAPAAADRRPPRIAPGVTPCRLKIRCSPS